MKGAEMCLLFAALGYLLGSMHFCDFILRRFKGIDVKAVSPDGNPGTCNAYQFGGFWCGTATLLLDLLKGTLPVAACLRVSPGCQTLSVFALTLAAPVMGHAFSVLHHGHGGKAIAASFGVLLGLFPMYLPAVLLAGCYLFFTLIWVVNPHRVRSIVTFAVFSALCAASPVPMPVKIGCTMISAVVVLKHLPKPMKAREEGCEY